MWQNHISQMSGYQTIKHLIEQFESGKVFFPDDFVTLGSSDTIRSALVRLCDEGSIVRVGFGIYFKPQIEKKWGLGILYPSLDNIAKAIAKRDKCRIAPTGSSALSILGLTTQLQTNAVYYTEGSPRQIKIGDNKGILFRKTTQMKRFAFKNELMQLIVAALKEIGKNKVAEEEKNIISERLKQVSDADFNADIILAPVWIQKLLKEIR